MAALGFSPATPLDLVRAQFKDEHYTARVQDELRDALGAVCDASSLAGWQDELEACARALYFGSNALAGAATLGEEYCELVPVVSGSSTSPRHWRGTAFSPARVRVWAAAHVCLTYLQAKLLRILRRLARGSSPGARAAALLVSFCVLAQRAHAAFAFTGGPYLELTRRLFGLRYIRYGSLPANANPAPPIDGAGPSLQRRAPPEQRFDLVAALIWAQVALSTALAASRAAHELLEHPAVTPCGHVFCWACVTEWTHTKPECPVCRQPASLRSIITAMHYD